MPKITTIQIDSDLVPALVTAVCVTNAVVEAANGPLGPMMLMLEPDLVKSIALMCSIASGYDTMHDFQNGDMHDTAHKLHNTLARLSKFAANTMKADIEAHGEKISTRSTGSVGG